MKKISLLVIIILIGIGCSKKEKSVNNTDKFTIKRGLNVSHWISQSSKRGVERENYMSAKDFKVIAEMGFDHIRLPIDEEHMWNEDGTKDEAAFRLMHSAIDWAFDNDLRVIVDLHVIRAHHFNDPNNRELWEDKSAQENFINFWRQLSTELKIYPNAKLAYEPLNEAVAEKPEEWNNLINWVISEIRKLEPERTIIMGSNRWQTVGTFKDLQVPQNDPNIILSFHYYEPFLLTHYKASWSSLKDINVPVYYPGPHIKEEDYKKIDKEYVKILKGLNQNFDRVSMENEIIQAVEVAKKNKLKLFCGEFGCYPTTDLLMRVEWYKDMMYIFDKYDIAWSHWNYKNDFPVVDEDLEPIQEIVDIMIPEN